MTEFALTPEQLAELHSRAATATQTRETVAKS